MVVARESEKEILCRFERNGLRRIKKAPSDSG
jgi:hypothetical protein